MYLKYVSPRSLKLEGGISHQVPEDCCFSLAKQGTVNPAFGRYKKLLDDPFISKQVMLKLSAHTQYQCRFYNLVKHFPLPLSFKELSHKPPLNCQKSFSYQN